MLYFLYFIMYFHFKWHLISLMLYYAIHLHRWIVLVKMIKQIVLFS